MKNNEEDFRILSLLSRMAFKANDIHACSMKINPDTEEDYRDTVVTMLYQWELDEKIPLVITWDIYISAVDPESLPVFLN